MKIRSLRLLQNLGSASPGHSVRKPWPLVVLLLALFASFARADYVVDGLTGAVTQNELDTFITNISAEAIPTRQWNPQVLSHHSQMAHGEGGQQLRSIHTMYRIARDNPAWNAQQMKLMNLAIKWTETWLVRRNDLPLGEGRTMWTGAIEPIWPSHNPKHADYSTYACAEQSETVGNMAETALNILTTPSIWSLTVPDGDPNSYGATYLARAKKYASILDYTLRRFVTRYFVDEEKAFFKKPTVKAAEWDAASGNSLVTAWNIVFNGVDGYRTMAQVLDQLGTDSTRADFYRKLVSNWFDLFAESAIPTKAANGTRCYDWGYGNYGGVEYSASETIPGHANSEMSGITDAWQAGFYTTVTNGKMLTFANTAYHQIRSSSTSWNGRINGSDPRDINYLPEGFMYLVPWSSDLYKQGATNAINTNRQQTHSYTTSAILWGKHWFHTHVLPSGYSDRDIGSPAIIGDGSHAYGTFTVRAGGAGIGGTRDEFHFLSRAVNGDVAIIARVVSQDNTSTNGAKVGLMIRAGLAEGDINVGLYSTPGGSVQLIARSTTGGSATTAAGVNGVVGVKWLQIMRVGSTYTGFYSLDGDTWTSVGSTAVTMPATAHVGLAVTASNTKRLNTAIFDEVGIVGLTRLAGTATASSIWSADYSADKAIDDSDTTRWNSANNQTNDQWLMIDFGSAKAFQQVIIKEPAGFTRVSEYKLQASVDGVAFTDLVTGTTIGANRLIDLPETTARYLRLYITSATDWPTISDFRAYP